MNENALNYIMLGVSGIATISQTDEVFRLIQVILTCISTLVVIAYNVYKWYVKAKADGKITADEVEDLGDIIKDSLEEKKDKEVK